MCSNVPSEWPNYYVGVLLAVVVVSGAVILSSTLNKLRRHLRRLARPFAFNLYNIQVRFNFLHRWPEHWQAGDEGGG